MLATSQTRVTPSTSSTKQKSKVEGSSAKTQAKSSSTSAKSKSTKSTTAKTTAFEEQRRIWRKHIKNFRKDLRNAKPIVDDTPPSLSIRMYYNKEALRGEQKDILMFYDLNPEIVKLLHRINVFGGKTDTLQFNYNRYLPSSNFIERRNEALYIQESNKIMKQMIESTKSRLPSVKDYAKFWKKMEDLMGHMSVFPLFWKEEGKKKKKETIEVGPCRSFVKQYVTEKSAKYPDRRPRVFIEVSIKNGSSIGKMVAVLFSDYVPMTVKNFLAFCNPKAELTYKGCFFYLIFDNFYCQTGDVVENKGFGGTSIYGPYFGNEDHTLKHGERGVLTMFNKVPNRNQSQFLITFRELQTLNGNNVVFGKIIRGFHVLDAIESVGSRMTGRPKVDIYISDCDEI